MKKRDLRFVIIPKCAHPWADEVHRGALAQASLLSEQLGIAVVIDYQAPSVAGVQEQISALDRAAATILHSREPSPQSAWSLSSMDGARWRSCEDSRPRRTTRSATNHRRPC